MADVVAVPYAVLTAKSGGGGAEIPGEVAPCLLDESHSTDVQPYFTSKWNHQGAHPKWIEVESSEGAFSLVKYALKSANDSPERDPKEWTLFGVRADGTNVPLHEHGKQKIQDNNTAQIDPQLPVPCTITVTRAETTEPHGQGAKAWPNDRWRLAGYACGKPAWSRRGNPRDFIRWDGQRWTLNGMQPKAYFQNTADTFLPPKAGWEPADMKVKSMPELSYNESPATSGEETAAVVTGHWTEHKDIDMSGQGDVEIVHNWRATHSIQDLKDLVVKEGYTAFTVSSGEPSFGHAALKEFDYQLTEEHCTPISTTHKHPCTIYIYHREGGSNGKSAGTLKSFGDVLKMDELSEAKPSVWKKRWNWQEWNLADVGEKFAKFRLEVYRNHGDSHGCTQLGQLRLFTDAGDLTTWPEELQSAARAQGASAQTKKDPSKIERFVLTLSDGNAGPKGIVPKYPEVRQAGPWWYQEMKVEEYDESAGGVFEVEYDGQFLALAPGSAAFESNGEMVFDVVHWKYEESNTVILVKADEDADEDTRKEGGGRDFVIHEDGTISPTKAQYLVLGALEEKDGQLGLVARGSPAACVLKCKNESGQSVPPPEPGPEAQQWLPFLSEKKGTYASFPTGTSLTEMVETFRFTRTWDGFATIGSSSGRNEYTVTEEGKLKHKHHDVFCELDAAAEEFRWSHNYTSAPLPLPPKEMPGQTLKNFGLLLRSHVGMAIRPEWVDTRNAWGKWDYIHLVIGSAVQVEDEALAPLAVDFDGQFIALAPGSAAFEKHGEMVFDVSMWQYKVGNHLVLVKVDPSNSADKTRQEGGGRDFVVYADGTVSPAEATHLVLGAKHEENGDKQLRLVPRGSPEACVLAEI